jgi:hypothetical protein
VRELPSAVPPMLGMPAHRAVASSWTVRLHRAANRGPSTQRGVQRVDLVLLVALASGGAQRPCARPPRTVGRRHRHQNGGASFGSGDVLNPGDEQAEEIRLFCREVKGFKKRGAAGPTGLRPEHLNLLAEGRHATPSTPPPTATPSAPAPFRPSSTPSLPAACGTRRWPHDTTCSSSTSPAGVHQALKAMLGCVRGEGQRVDASMAAQMSVKTPSRLFTDTR